MSSELKKDLEKSKLKHLKDVTKELLNENSSEVLALPAGDPNLVTLQKMGLDHEIKAQQKVKQSIDSIVSRDEFYRADCYKGSQIQKLCNLYSLAIKPLPYYNGTVPKDLPQVCLDFLKNRNIDDTSLDNIFYILAPREIFKDGHDSDIIKYEPIVFYKESRNGTTYKSEIKEDDVLVEVKDWGSGFSKFRLIRPFFSSISRDHYDDNESCPPALATSIGIIFLFISLITALSGELVIMLLFIIAGVLSIWRSYFLIEKNRTWAKF